MLYADWHQDQVGLSVGYQHVVDPSQLIVDQFMPGLQLRFQSGRIQISGFVGQLPETAFGGLGCWREQLRARQFLVDRSGILDEGTYHGRPGFCLSDSRELDREILLHSGLLGFPLVSADSLQKLILSVKLVGATMVLLMEETRPSWHTRVGLSSVMDSVSRAAKPRSVLEPPIFRQKKVAKVMVGRQHFGGPVSCPVRQYGSQKMNDKIGTITLMKGGQGVEAHF